MLKSYLWLDIARATTQSMNNCEAFSLVLTITNEFWLARAYLILELQGDILMSTHPLPILPIVLSRIRDLTEEHSAVCHPGTSI